MKTSFRSVAGGKLLLLATVLAVVSGIGGLGATESTLLGNWFTETEIAISSGQTEKRAIVWKITGATDLTMCAASTETGAISTNPDTWAVRRPAIPATSLTALTN